MQQLRSFAAISYLLLAPLIAEAQSAELPKPESFKTGDRWEWHQFDNRTKLEEGRRFRTVVEDEGIKKFSDGQSTGQISEAFLGAPAKKAWRVWPLAVGQTWSHDGDWRRADGVTGNTSADVKVTAYEEVVVPAGKFMAFKIEHRGFYSNSSGGRGKQIDTFWYSPEVTADIKHIRDDGYNQYTRELVNYLRSTP